MENLVTQVRQSLKAKDLHKVAQGLEDIVELSQLLPITDWVCCGLFFAHMRLIGSAESVLEWALQQRLHQ